MDLGSFVYLGVTIGLFVIFVLIVKHTYSRKRKDVGEAAKYNMMDEDD